MMMISVPKIHISSQFLDNPPKIKWWVIARYFNDYLEFVCGEENCLPAEKRSEHWLLTEIYSNKFFKHPDEFLHSSQTMFKSYGFWRALISLRYD